MISAPVEPARLEQFTNGYLAAALWSTNDDSGNPLDAKYSEADIDPATLERMKADCGSFYEAWQEYIDAETCLEYDSTPESRGGHDFWLTRNGHGAGFWDGDWEAAAGKKLTAASHIYGEFNIYVGDDGKIYH